MTSVAALYNTFPSLEQANEKFSNREHIFPMLAAALTGYEDEFAVNLVHGHSKLEEGEKMVTTGNITKPMTDVKCYPERWLATGQAYVFNTNPTESPPEDLLEKFKAVVDTVGHIGGVGVLAVSYIKNLPVLEESGKVLMESTVDREDILRPVPETQEEMIWTCWKSVNGRMHCHYTCQKDSNHDHQRIGYNEAVHGPQDDGPSH